MPILWWRGGAEATVLHVLYLLQVTHQLSALRPHRNQRCLFLPHHTMVTLHSTFTYSQAFTFSVFLATQDMFLLECFKVLWGALFTHSIHRAVRHIWMSVLSRMQIFLFSFGSLDTSVQWGGCSQCCNTHLDEMSEQDADIPVFFQSFGHCGTME